MKPLFIFDLDGTLANIEHRLHHITGDKNDWGAFFDACKDDQPFPGTIKMLRLLRNSGAEIQIWTGRNESARPATERWLAHYVWHHDSPLRLLMRGERDRRPDYALKQEWLDRMTDDDVLRIVAVFEDRTQVVKMYRAAGVRCLQVADGDF